MNNEQWIINLVIPRACPERSRREVEESVCILMTDISASLDMTFQTFKHSNIQTFKH